MARTNSLSLMLLHCLLLPAHVNAGFGDFLKLFACWFGSDRCGFFGLAVKMHRGYPNTLDCEETCSYFPAFQSSYSCGGCDYFVDELTPIPTSSPVKAPTPPIPAITDSPSISPAPVVTTDAPTETSTKAPTSKPSGSPTKGSSPESNFNIAIELVGDAVTDATIFTEAVDRWGSVITGDLVDKSGTGLDISAYFPDCTVPSSIDDVYICAKYQSWDGRGGTLAVAAPLIMRALGEGGLPYVGGIIVDAADVDRLRTRGDLYPVIVHEMGHVSTPFGDDNPSAITSVDSSYCSRYQTI